MTKNGIVKRCTLMRLNATNNHIKLKSFVFWNLKTGSKNLYSFIFIAILTAISD